LKQALERRAEMTFSNVTAVVVSVLVDGLKEELGSSPASEKTPHRGAALRLAETEKAP